jgi:hypothetical protein
MKVKKHEKEITYFLTNKPHLRDNDLKLLATIWWNEVKDKRLDTKTMSAHDLLDMLADGKLSNPSSIRRCRAKLQEVNPSLRGKRYTNRKKDQTTEVKDELRNW